MSDNTENKYSCETVIDTTQTSNHPAGSVRVTSGSAASQSTFRGYRKYNKATGQDRVYPLHPEEAARDFSATIGQSLGWATDGVDYTLDHVALPAEATGTELEENGPSYITASWVWLSPAEKNKRFDINLWMTEPTYRDDFWDVTNATGKQASIRFKRYGNDNQECYIPEHWPEAGESVLSPDLENILSDAELERADEKARAVLGVKATPPYELFRIGSAIVDGRDDDSKLRPFYFGLTDPSPTVATTTEDSQTGQKSSRRSTRAKIAATWKGLLRSKGSGGSGGQGSHD